MTIPCGLAPSCCLGARTRVLIKFAHFLPADSAQAKMSQLEFPSNFIRTWVLVEAPNCPLAVLIKKTDDGQASLIRDILVNTGFWSLLNISDDPDSRWL